MPDARLSTTLHDYEPLRELGAGATGRVVEARHRPTGALRALKMLEGLADPERLLRFQREAETLARVGGQGVVPIHACGIQAGRAWLVMSLMPGGSLAARLATAGRLPWRAAVELIARLADGLERCHQAGVVHRDLKPQNVLFDEQDAPRLADFGAVRDLFAAHALSESGTVVGTPLYMAPEQLAGSAADARSDVYALGVILHQLIGGALPYQRQDAPIYTLLAEKLGGKRPRLAELVPGVPPDLDVLLDRVLAPAPERRPPSAAHLARELRAVREGAAPRGRWRRRAVLVGAALALAAGAWVGAGGLPAGRTAGEEPARPGSQAALAPTAPAVASTDAPPLDPLLERAQARLLDDLAAAEAGVAAVESGLRAGGRLSAVTRDAFVLAAVERARQASLEGALMEFSLDAYEASVRPFQLARRVARLGPQPASPPAVPQPLAERGRSLLEVHSTDDPRLFGVLARYVEVEPRLAGAITSIVTERLGARRSSLPFQPALEALDAAEQVAPDGAVYLTRALLLLRGEAGQDRQKQRARERAALPDLERAARDRSLSDAQRDLAGTRLAAALERLGQYDEALAACLASPGVGKPALSPAWRSRFYLTVLARIMVRTGRLSDAADVLRRAAGATGDREHYAELTELAALAEAASREGGNEQRLQLLRRLLGHEQ